MNGELDPIRYEVCVRRLNSILEQGRQAIAMISGSPAIVEGGEFMTSLYDGQGKGILTAAGTLFHVMGTADSVRHAIGVYEDNPGIGEGDQFFYNDPYVAGTHLMDQIVIKPIFYGNRRVAWTGAMTHTGDVGGVQRGASKEIFHEGVRIRGLKIVEGGRVRLDTLNAITQQCRDPEWVTQDILARIAANNVCAEGYLQLADKMGLEFLEAACDKLRDDSKKMFQAKLLELPDGIWRERCYVSRSAKVVDKEESLPLKVEVTLTKKGDQLRFDVEASPQTADYCNAALPAARSCLFSALAASLLVDVSWNSDVMEWVDYHIPEGTWVNCRFPASCGFGTRAGIILLTATAGCIAKMLYAAGVYDHVNASWGTLGGSVTGFGPGVWYGGHDQLGRNVAPGAYDNFAGGQGATPSRDGNDTGGYYVNAKAAISDVEWTENYFPLLHLARRHGVDSGGYGKFRGGMNLEVVAIVYGSRDLNADYLPGPKGKEARGFGLFGGYPMGGNLGDSRLLLTSKEDLLRRFSEGRYPTDCDELSLWGREVEESTEFKIERELGGIRINIPEYSLLFYSYGCGGGYGDPLDRDPMMVVRDIRNGAVRVETAAKVYGVVANNKTLEVDWEKTEDRRREIRRERLNGSRVPAADGGLTDTQSRRRTLTRIAEYLEVVERIDGTKTICCVKCGHGFCVPEDNYKKYAVQRIRELDELKKVGRDGANLTCFQEYICPGCATLLQVDVWCPSLDTRDPLWDIKLDYT